MRTPHHPKFLVDNRTVYSKVNLMRLGNEQLALKVDRNPAFLINEPALAGLVAKSLSVRILRLRRQETCRSLISDCQSHNHSWTT